MLFDCIIILLPIVNNDNYSSHMKENNHRIINSLYVFCLYLTIQRMWNDIDRNGSNAIVQYTHDISLHYSNTVLFYNKQR